MSGPVFVDVPKAVATGKQVKKCEKVIFKTKKIDPRGIFQNGSVQKRKSPVAINPVAENKDTNIVDIQSLSPERNTTAYHMHSTPQGTSVADAQKSEGMVDLYKADESINGEPPEVDQKESSEVELPDKGTSKAERVLKDISEIRVKSVTTEGKKSQNVIFEVVNQNPMSKVDAQSIIPQVEKPKNGIPADTAQNATFDIEIGGNSSSELEKASQKELANPRATPKESSTDLFHQSPAKNTRSKNKVGLATSKITKNKTPRVRIRSKSDRRKLMKKKSKVSHKNGKEATTLSDEAMCGPYCQKKPLSEKASEETDVLTGAAFPCVQLSGTSLSPESDSQMNVLAAVDLHSSPRKLTLRYGLRSTEVDSQTMSRASPIKNQNTSSSFPNSSISAAALPLPPFRRTKENQSDNIVADSPSAVQCEEKNAKDLIEIKSLPSPKNHKDNSNAENAALIDSRHLELQPHATVVVSDDENVKVDDIMQQLAKQVKMYKNGKTSNARPIMVETSLATTGNVFIATMSNQPGLPEPSISQEETDKAVEDLVGSMEEAHPVCESPVSVPSIPISYSNKVMAELNEIKSNHVTLAGPEEVDERIDSLCQKNISGRSMTVLLNETSLTQMMEAASEMKTNDLDFVPHSRSMEPKNFRTISPSTGIFSIFANENLKPVPTQQTGPQATASVFTSTGTTLTIAKHVDVSLSSDSVDILNAVQTSVAAFPDENDPQTQNLRLWLNTKVSTSSGEMLKPNKKPAAVCRTLNFKQSSTSISKNKKSRNSPLKNFRSVKRGPR